MKKDDINSLEHCSAMREEDVIFAGRERDTAMTGMLTQQQDIDASANNKYTLGIEELHLVPYFVAAVRHDGKVVSRINPDDASVYGLAEAAVNRINEFNKEIKDMVANAIKGGASDDQIAERTYSDASDFIGYANHQHKRALEIVEARALAEKFHQGMIPPLTDRDTEFGVFQCTVIDVEKDANGNRFALVAGLDKKTYSLPVSGEDAFRLSMMIFMGAPGTGNLASTVTSSFIMKNGSRYYEWLQPPNPIMTAALEAGHDTANGFDENMDPF